MIEGPFYRGLYIVYQNMGTFSAERCEIAVFSDGSAVIRYPKNGDDEPHSCIYRDAYDAFIRFADGDYEVDKADGT